ncbi:uncharacterized protein LOC141640952 [Silene latifolia]|uniref:uncharacterized protein LOC141640952 n=1 Tax=Silene latifolia TaxID=37657 RepID=UPI003D775FE3
MSIKEYTNKFVKLSRFITSVAMDEPVHDCALSIYDSVLAIEAEKSVKSKKCDGKVLTCYLCKSLGHKAVDYPQKPKTDALKTSAPKVDALKTGRVFVMSRAEADANPDLVACTFQVHSLSAFALFYTGASMSFVFESFSVRAGLSSSSFVDTSISIPIGENVSCSVLFKDVPVSIAGAILPPNLVQFKLGEFDVILSMDWLARYDARFQCCDQKIGLKSPTSSRVSYQGVRVTPKVKWVSALKMVSMGRKGHQIYLCSVRDVSAELKLENIPAVKEFPDVFPDVLPGSS